MPKRCHLILKQAKKLDLFKIFKVLYIEKKKKI